MKKRIIKIQDVSQIDTSKVSVYDLNNRYIDNSGHIYGLKYNKDLKKVEIIKLERIHVNDSILLQKRSQSARDIRHMRDTSHLKSEQTEDEEEEDIPAVTVIEPEIFINEVMNSAEVHRERINGIIKNIYDSDIFPKENKSESSEFDDIVRNLEIDGIQQLEKLVNYYKELTNYPRSTTYYQAKMDNSGKQIFDKITGNKEKLMRFIVLYEMGTSIKRTYSNLNRHITRLEDFTADKNTDDKPYITKFQRQAFIDSRTSITNTIHDIDTILKKNAIMLEYACNISNFQK